jgi:NADH-quinone oxidoreductase subunit F
MPGMSICGLPDGAVYPIRTIVQKYRKEFEDHIARQPAGYVEEYLKRLNPSSYAMPIDGVYTGIAKTASELVGS